MVDLVLVAEEAVGGATLKGVVVNLKVVINVVVVDMEVVTAIDKEVVRNLSKMTGHPMSKMRGTSPLLVSL